MNKEKILNSLAKIITKIFYFIVCPAIAIFLIASIYVCIQKVIARPIPLKDWAIAFSIVASFFGFLWLVGWALERKSYNSDPDREWRGHRENEHDEN